MRQSQIVFEACLKEMILKEPLIQCHWEHSFESLTEDDDGVTSQISTPSSTITLKSRYVIGCDGAGSKVRQSTGIVSHRKPMRVQSMHVLTGQ